MKKIIMFGVLFLASCTMTPETDLPYSFPENFRGYYTAVDGSDEFKITEKYLMRRHTSIEADIQSVSVYHITEILNNASYDFTFDYKDTYSRAVYGYDTYYAFKTMPSGNVEFIRIEEKHRPPMVVESKKEYTFKSI